VYFFLPNRDRHGYRHLSPAPDRPAFGVAAYSPPRRLFATDIDNAIGDTAIGVRLAVVARNI
jgi:hypothetical protein